MTNNNLLIFGMIGTVVVIIIGIVVYLTVFQKKSNNNNNNGSNCKDQYESCSTSFDCCAPYSCINGSCDKLKISNPITAFQLSLPNNKYLGLTQDKKIGIVEKNDTWNSWWSWDGTTLRFLVDGNIYNILPPIDKGAVLFSEGAVIPGAAIASGNSLASIVSSDRQFCTDMNNDILMWYKCIDNPSGRSLQFQIELTSHCSSAGTNCTKSLECCLNGDCQDGVCVVCLASEKHDNCPEGSKPICNNYTGKWACQSNCDPKDKVKLNCKDTEHASCILNGNTWEWGCVSDCTGQRPNTCAQSVCQYDKDTKQYEYQCVTECGGDTHIIKPPAIPSGCTIQKNCPGDQNNRICMECDREFKKMYYDCATGQWKTEDFCDPNNIPKCSTGESPACVSMISETCGGKNGYTWVCPKAPGDWCKFASYNKLVSQQACEDGSTNCDITYYETSAGIPVYPTISYNNCSSSKSTLPTDEDYAENPKGFVNVTSTGTTLYRSDKQDTIEGEIMQYSDKYVYYKPSKTEKGNNPPYCLMFPDTCTHGSININKENQLEGHANFSVKDPRVTDFNNPPVPSTLPNVGNCSCNSGYLGYYCNHTQSEANNVCHNNGTGVTSDDPANPIACQCNQNTIGKFCDISTRDCNNIGIPYGSTDSYQCICNPALGKGKGCEFSVNLPMITYYTGKNMSGTNQIVKLDQPDSIGSISLYGVTENVVIGPVNRETVVETPESVKTPNWYRESLVVGFGDWEQLYINCYVQQEGTQGGCHSEMITPNTANNTYEIPDLQSWLQKIFPDYFKFQNLGYTGSISLTLGTTSNVPEQNLTVNHTKAPPNCSLIAGNKTPWSLNQAKLYPGSTTKPCTQICGENLECVTGWNKSTNKAVECIEKSDVCMCI